MHALYDTLPIVDASELGARFADKKGPPGFLFWRKYCAESPKFSVGDVMKTVGGRAAMSDAILAAYEAPFPDARYEAGARQFPSLVPVFPDDPEIPANQAAWEILAAFDRPFLTAFGDSDPVTAGAEKTFQKRVAGAKSVEHVTIRGAGHFLQEEQGETVAQAMIDFMRRTPSI
jgi:haloalkane dehalogenase